MQGLGYDVCSVGMCAYTIHMYSMQEPGCVVLVCRGLECVSGSAYSQVCISHCTWCLRWLLVLWKQGVGLPETLPARGQAGVPRGSSASGDTGKGIAY